MVYVCVDTYTGDGVHACTMCECVCIHGMVCMCVYAYMGTLRMGVYTYMGDVCTCVYTYMGHTCVHGSMRMMLGALLHLIP